MAMNGCIAGRLSGIIGRTSGRASTRDKPPGITDLAPHRAAVRISQVIRDLDAVIVSTASSSTPISSRTGWSTYGPAEL